MRIQNTDFQTALLETQHSILFGDQEWMPKLRTINDLLRQLTDREHLSVAGILAGVSLMSAVTFVAGIDAMSYGAPEAWSHGLLALSIGEIAVVGGSTLKFHKRIENNRRMLLALTRSSARGSPVSPRKAVESTPSRVISVATNDGLAHGSLAGREYVSFADGSIEIDTRLGRRRFVSIEAAREFVGD
jgi:hypothetical protein